jgi:hypothetical protein
VRVKFVLVCEGSSDRGLVPHLEALCVRAGATEAIGDAPDLGRLPRPPGKAVADQVGAILRLGAEINLLFVHRDSDARDPTTVRRQIDDAMASLTECPMHVCVVPVQEIEAWLLTEEAAIRQVAGNPDGREELELPARRNIENTASPKEVLKAAILRASGEKGRRLDKLRAQFSPLRATLLQRLDIDGPINDLPAWGLLKSDIENAVAKLLRDGVREQPRAPAQRAARKPARRGSRR